VLKEYIRSSLDILGLPDTCVTTFDSWCTDFYRKNIEGSLPKVEGGKPDFDKIRNDVREHLQQPFLEPIFDFILVDEGQDLDSVAYDILKKLTKHISVFMDHKQQVYRQGTSEQDILSFFGSTPKKCWTS
jgi:superfamily I DNA and RNA helicase